MGVTLGVPKPSGDVRRRREGFGASVEWDNGGVPFGLGARQGPDFLGRWSYWSWEGLEVSHWDGDSYMIVGFGRIGESHCGWGSHWVVGLSGLLFYWGES